MSTKWLPIGLLIWPAMTLAINLVARTLNGPASYPIFSFLGQPWMFFPGTFFNGLAAAIERHSAGAVMCCRASSPGGVHLVPA